MSLTFYAASVGHRYGETCQTFVALERGVDTVGSSGLAARLEALAEESAEYERCEIIANCDSDREYNERHEDDEPCDCAEDVVTYGAWPYSAKDLFTASELAEHRRALMRGEVVVLYS